MSHRFTPTLALLLIAFAAWASPGWADQQTAPRDTLAGHKEPIRSVAFSPNGKLMASASDDGDVRVFDINSGQAKFTLAPPQHNRSDQAVESVAFSPDGKSIVYGAMNGTVKLCDIATGKELATFTGGKTLRTVAFVAGGKQVAAGAIDRDVTADVWDIASGKPLKHVAYKAEESSYELPMAISPDGNTVAWASTQYGRDTTHSIKLLDIASGKVRDQLFDPDVIDSIAWSPDGSRLIDGNSQGWVRVWDAKTARQLNALQSQDLTGPADAVAISSDDRLLAAGIGSSAAVWNLATGRQIVSIATSTGGPVMAVALSPDEKILATGTEMAFTTLWDVPAQPLGPRNALVPQQPRAQQAARTQRHWPGGTGFVYRVAWSPDGKLIASAGEDRAVRLWDPSTGQKLGELQRHSQPVTGLEFSPDGKTLASIDDIGLIVLWDVAAQRPRLSFGAEGEHNTLPGGRDLSFLSDGKTLAATSEGGIRLWDTATGKLITNIKGPQATPSTVVCSSDGHWLACGYPQQENSNVGIRVFDLKRGAQVATIPSAMAMAFSPDGQVMATDKPGAVQLWDPSTGRLLATLGQHRYHTSCVAFSSDGAKVASGGIDGAVKFWDARSHRQLATFPGQSGDTIYSVAFSPDGQHLVAARTREIVVWDITSVQPQSRANPALTPDASAPVLAAADWSWQPSPVRRSPDDRRTQPNQQSPASNDDQPLRFTPEPSPGPQTPPVLKGLEANITTIAFSPDSKLIATGCDDSTIATWDAATARQLNKLTGHAGAIMSLAFSTDGKTLISYAQDQSARIWDVATGKSLSKFALPMGAAASTNAACSPDGRTLALGGMHMQGPMPTLALALWDVPTGKERLSIQGNMQNPHQVFAFSADGKMLAAAGSLAGAVKVWDASSGKELASFNADPKGITSLVFSADGKSLATLGGSRDARVFDIKTGKEIGKLPAQPTANTAALAISPDGKTIATETPENIVLWDLATGSRRTEIRVISNSPRLAFAPDRHMLAYTTSDRTVVLYPTGPLSAPGTAGGAAVTVREVAVIKDQRQPVEAVVFSHNGKLLATAAGDNFFRLYDVPAFKQRKAISHQWVGSVAFTPDDRQIVSSTTMNAWNSTLWDVATGQRLARFNSGGPVAISPDGKTLFTSNPNIGFWDLATHQETRQVPHPSPLRSPITLCHNGHLLAWLSQGVLHLTDTATGQLRQEIPAQQRGYITAIDSFACAPDGTIATAQANGNRITIWDPAGKETDWFEVYTPDTSSARIQRLAFSPAANILAVAIDNYIRIIDPSTHKEIASFGAYELGPRSLAFSPDGRYLAAGMDDGEIHIYEVSNK